MAQKKKPAPGKQPVAAPTRQEATSEHTVVSAANTKTLKTKKTKENDPPPSVPDFFDALGNKARWFAIGLILLIGVFVFRDFIFSDKLFFFKDIGSDTLNYNYPYAREVSSYIAKHGIPKWSFNFDIGQSLFPFFLRDPFDIILYIAGKDNFPYVMVYKELLKIVLAGYTFYCFLKMVKLSEYTSILGGAIFSFTGFMMVGAGWYIFSFEALNMAMMLLGFEQLFQKGKWLLFTLSIFLICISQPFNLFIYGIFFATYVFFRLFQEDNFSWKNTGIIWLKLAGLGLLGILLSGPLMLENVVALLESPRGSGNTSYANIFLNAPMFGFPDPVDLGISVMRLFSSDLLGSGNDFIKGIPSNSNFLEAPMFYCGLSTLVLFPQVFQFLDRKRKIAFFVLIAFWTFPIILPYFRFALWLYTGNYFRGYSIMVGFCLLYASLFALDLILKYRKVNLIVLAVTLVCLYLLLFHHYFPTKDEINEMNQAYPGTKYYMANDIEVINTAILTFVCVFIFIYAALLFYMGKKDAPQYVKYIFMALVVFELMYMSNTTINDRIVQFPPPRTDVSSAPLSTTDLKSKQYGYNDYTVDAVKYIKQMDHSFYRIDKVYGSSPAMHYSINDGMAQDYMGTTGYSPFNEITYILYLQLTGIANKSNELQSRWAVGLAYRPILETENQVKYLLSKGPISYISRAASDSLTTIGDVRIYRNRFVLPFGFTYDKYLPESVYKHFGPDQKDFVSLKTTVVSDSDLSKVQAIAAFNLNDTVKTFDFNQYKAYTDLLRQDTLQITHFEDTKITGKIDVPEPKIMYLSIPFDKGWTLKVDGQKREKLALMAGMTGVMLSKGHHEIEMTYELRYFTTGVYLSVIGLILLAGLFFLQYRNKKSTAS